MTDNEKRAHDLALLYVQYQLDIEREGTDANHCEEVVLDMYKSAFNNFFENLNP